MPTERFMRLPKEKIEAIRAAAAKEFMRVAPEEVSINRIVHDADISRGSFYTYFEDKQDLLKWLICNQAEQHFNIVHQRLLDENGGDLWEVLEQICSISGWTGYGAIQGLISDLSQPGQQREDW